ncbi:MAG: DMT family transporter [Beijerinckiaceae bacterium]|nr:DMT family transporter [Beijerinckiaceae bacterium]
MMLTLGKAYSAYPVAQIVFFRSAFALIPVLIWLLLRGDFPRALHTKRFGGHLFRSLAGVGSMFCIFTAYALLPLADATAIGYASPLMILVLASAFLGEKMTAVRWGAVIAGFAGVLMMLWEHLGAAHVGDHPRSAAGAAFMLAAAFLIAIAMLQTRRLTKTEDTGAITFYFQSTTTVASGLVIVAGALWPSGAPFAGLIQGQAWVAPEAAHWAPLVAIGLLGGVGQILMTQGYRYAEPSVLATFDYSSLLFAVAIGFVIFGDVPTTAVLVGAVIVISAGLAVVWQESRRPAASPAAQ